MVVKLGDVWDDLSVQPELPYLLIVGLESAIVALGHTQWHIHTQWDSPGQGLLRCSATHKLKSRRTLYECQSKVLSLKLFKANSSVELLLQNINCAREYTLIYGQFRK